MMQTYHKELLHQLNIFIQTEQTFSYIQIKYDENIMILCKLFAKKYTFQKSPNNEKAMFFSVLSLKKTKSFFFWDINTN